MENKETGWQEPLFMCAIWTGGSVPTEMAEFEMELPVGLHQLKLSYMGYEPQKIQMELIEDGAVLFDLFEETHSLDEITVKADNSGVRNERR